MIAGREAASGAIELRYRGQLMRWREIPAPPPKGTPPPIPSRPAARIAARVRRGPSADHLWSRGYDERQEERIAASLR